jgi:hypothetical protein
LNSLNPRLEKTSSAKRQRAERRHANGLAAFHWDGTIPEQSLVRDISSTGAYLETQKRWTPGELIALTLQRKGPLARTPEHRFEVQARAVRSDRDGVGVSFVLPKGADLHLWESSLMTADEQNEPEDILGKFRTAAAISFLRRKCPAAAKAVRDLLREKLSNYRLQSAVEIALRAEEMLVFEPHNGKMIAHPSLVLRILENGSWAENERILEFWSGLLAISCSTQKDDLSNAVFVDLLSRLSAVHARIFAAACAKVVIAESKSEAVRVCPLICTADEIIQIAGSLDLVKIDGDLEQLAEFGLLVRSEKSRLLSHRHDADITPTNLGLQLYARCNGHRGDLLTFYGLCLPVAPVA